MMSSSGQKLQQHSGVALIQVLLLSLIMSVLFVSIIASVKSDLSDATKIQQRSEALVAMHSMESETLFALLTHDRVVNEQSVLELPKHWNFWGDPLTSDAGKIHLYDTAGLFSLYSDAQMRFLLSQYLQDPDEVSQIAMRISALAKPRALIPEDMTPFIAVNPAPQIRYANLQLIDELRFVPGISQQTFAAIRPLITTYPLKSVNPAVMPAALMAMYVPEPTLSLILAQRAQGQLSSANFMSLSGLQFEDGFNAVPSNVLQIRFTATAIGVKLERDFVVILTPHETTPFSFWEYNKYSHAN